MPRPYQSEAGPRPEQRATGWGTERAALAAAGAMLQRGREMYFSQIQKYFGFFFGVCVFACVIL